MGHTRSVTGVLKSPRSNNRLLTRSEKCASQSRRETVELCTAFRIEDRLTGAIKAVTKFAMVEPT